MTVMPASAIHLELGHGACSSMVRDLGYRLANAGYTKIEPYYSVGYAPVTLSHIKLSRKSHARQFSQNGVGCGYLIMAVTGVFMKQKMRCTRNGLLHVICNQSLDLEVNQKLVIIHYI